MTWKALTRRRMHFSLTPNSQESEESVGIWPEMCQLSPASPHITQLLVSVKHGLTQPRYLRLLSVMILAVVVITDLRRGDDH